MTLRYEFDSDNAKSRPSAEKSENPIELYSDAGQLRHIILQNNEGMVRTYYYAWLKGIRMNGECTEITLEFGEDSVFLKGNNLGGLLEDLSAQFVRRIELTNQRYASLMDKSSYAVMSITFT
ncbi:MAG: hypothetical protein JSR97_10140 [Verrucomicrobia bacterium]|nr:hypothetical protein [Verrucomicrobiota bacterium]